MERASTLIASPRPLKPKAGRFRTLLFYPAAAAFRRNIYIVTLWLAPDGKKLGQQIVSALSSSSATTEYL